MTYHSNQGLAERPSYMARPAMRKFAMPGHMRGLGAGLTDAAFPGGSGQAVRTSSGLTALVQQLAPVRQVTPAVWPTYTAQPANPYASEGRPAAFVDQRQAPSAETGMMVPPPPAIPGTGPGTQYVPPSEEAPTDKPNYMLWGGLALLVVAAGGGLYYYSKKKAA